MKDISIVLIGEGKSAVAVINSELESLLQKLDNQKISYDLVSDKSKYLDLAMNLELEINVLKNIEDLEREIYEPAKTDYHKKYDPSTYQEKLRKSSKKYNSIKKYNRKIL